MRLRRGWRLGSLMRMKPRSSLSSVPVLLWIVYLSLKRMLIAEKCRGGREGRKRGRGSERAVKKGDSQRVPPALTWIPKAVPPWTLTDSTKESLAMTAVQIAAPLLISYVHIHLEGEENTYIMSNNADRPEVTAAIRKKSLARKKPVIRAITARQDPTYH